MLPALWFFCLWLPIIRALAQTDIPTTEPLYAVLGPEAPAILRVLIGSDHVVSLQPGDLADLIAQQSQQSQQSPDTLGALIVPDYWADESDLDVARQHGIKIVRVQRQ